MGGGGEEVVGIEAGQTFGGWCFAGEAGEVVESYVDEVVKPVSHGDVFGQGAFFPRLEMEVVQWEGFDVDELRGIGHHQSLGPVQHADKSVAVETLPIILLVPATTSEATPDQGRGFLCPRNGRGLYCESSITLVVHRRREQDLAVLQELRGPK